MAVLWETIFICKKKVFLLCNSVFHSLKSVTQSVTVVTSPPYFSSCFLLSFCVCDSVCFGWPSFSVDYLASIYNNMSFFFLRCCDDFFCEIRCCFMFSYRYFYILFLIQMDPLPWFLTRGNRSPLSLQVGNCCCCWDCVAVAVVVVAMHPLWHMLYFLRVTSYT